MSGMVLGDDSGFLEAPKSHRPQIHQINTHKETRPWKPFLDDR
jgi:hypothetical protein